MKARVFVTLKPSVFDPQGHTIVEALHSLGYDSVADVRQGKYFELDLHVRRAARPRRSPPKSPTACSPIPSSRASASSWRPSEPSVR